MVLIIIVRDDNNIITDLQDLHYFKFLNDKNIPTLHFN